MCRSAAVAEVTHQPTKIREGRSTIGCAVGEEGRLAARLRDARGLGRTARRTDARQHLGQSTRLTTGGKGGNLPTRQPLARRTHDQTARAGPWAWVWSPSSSPPASTAPRRSASLIGLTPSAALAAERACDSDALRRLLVARGTTNNHTQCAISKEAAPVRPRGRQMLQPAPPPSASLPSSLGCYEP